MQLELELEQKVMHAAAKRRIFKKLRLSGPIVRKIRKSKKKEGTQIDYDDTSSARYEESVK